jgi:hypothetical protein
MLLTVGVLSAGPASAAVERCSGPASVANGLTIRTCMLVSTSYGEARTRVSYNLSSSTYLTVCTYINRDANRQGNCETFFVPSGIGAFDKKIGANNPPGTQRWFAQSYAGAAAQSSPVVYDT